MDNTSGKIIDGLKRRLLKYRRFAAVMLSDYTLYPDTGFKERFSDSHMEMLRDLVHGDLKEIYGVITQRERDRLTMKKDRNMDISTDAFRYAAKVGGYEKYHNSLHNELTREVAEYFQRSEVAVIGGTEGNPIEAAHDKYQILIAQYEPELADLKAVEDTFSLLKALCQDSTKGEAIRIAYQSDIKQELTFKDISENVKVAATRLNTSISRIYDWLYDARAIYTWKRKLRLTTSQFNRLKKLGMI